MIRVNIHLARRQISALDTISKASGLKRSEHIRRSIDEYIDRISNKTFESKEVCLGCTGVSGA